MFASSSGLFENRIHTNTPVLRVERTPTGVQVATKGSTQTFDRVILAAHADQSLRMLKEPTPLEKELLAPFAYQANDVDLHSDRKFMPQKRLAWAAWNYRSDKQGESSIHYWMNCLQGVSEKKDYLVSLNTRDEIDPPASIKNYNTIISLRSRSDENAATPAGAQRGRSHQLLRQLLPLRIS